MAITFGHEFPAEHGFTGSAHPAKEHRPSIPGYKYGGHVEREVEKGIREHEDQEHEGRHSKLRLKKGGIAEKGSWSMDNKDHFGKSGLVDHDGEQNMNKTAYDEHGFQHLSHGGKSAKHHAGKHRKEG